MVRFVIAVLGMLCLAIGAAPVTQGQNKKPPAQDTPIGVWERVVPGEPTARLVLKKRGGGEFTWLSPVNNSPLTSDPVSSVKKLEKGYQIVTVARASGSTTATRITYTMEISEDGKTITLESGDKTYKLEKVEPKKP
jgi:hypothetical protein